MDSRFRRKSKTKYKAGVTAKSTFIKMMRAIARDPAARGLIDDTAVIAGQRNADPHPRHDGGGCPLASQGRPGRCRVEAGVGQPLRSCGKVRGLWGCCWGSCSATVIGTGALRRGSELAHYAVPLLGGDGFEQGRQKGSRADRNQCIARFLRAAGRWRAIWSMSPTLGDALAGFELIEAGLDAGDALSADKQADGAACRGAGAGPLCDRDDGRF